MARRPLQPPSTAELLKVFSERGTSPEKILSVMDAGRTAGKTYRPWDAIFRMTPPKNLTSEEWWLGIKIARRAEYRALPLTQTDGEPFVYALPDELLELLHFIDQHAGGEVAMAEAVVRDDSAKTQYLVNSLIEEAIRSSQLEGAITTRMQAKEMIRTGREPQDRSERMILNNYRALEFMREEAGMSLTPHLVLTLHQTLTEGTLDNPDAPGRLQRPDEVRIAVWDASDGTLLHQPPPADELERRLDLMCKFANGDLGPDGFLHPVLRAVILHFWLAHDHPFEDGNGRTARALFYWSMRTQGYWATEYLSISKILRQRRGKYRSSFLLTESDEGDTTYFLLDQLTVIRQAIEQFQQYLQRKMQEVKDFEHQIRQTEGLNHRQLALLRNAVRSPSQRYTFKSHKLSHKISFESARSDLTKLWNMDLLERRRVGREFVFTPAEDLAQRLTNG